MDRSIVSILWVNTTLMQPSPAMGPWRGGTGGIAGETFPNGVCPSAWVRAKLKEIENGMPVHYRYSHSPQSDTARHKSKVTQCVTK